MGADLYIEKLDDTRTYGGFEVSLEAVNDGYFRDCYNGIGLFSVISANLGITLSWWQTRDRKGFFNKNGCMTVAGAKKWLAELEPIAVKFKKLSKLYRSEYNMKKKCSEKDIKNPLDKKEYHEWMDLLLNFLKIAIKLKSPIIWSV